MDPFSLHLWPQFQHYIHEEIDVREAVIDEISLDSRRIHSKNALFIALKGKKHDGHHYLKQAEQNGARFAVIEDTYPLSEEDLKLSLHYLRVPSPLKAFQEIASAYKTFTGVKTIAICGSYGKTMLKDLLVHLLRPSIPVAASPESFNSQLGVPLSLLKIKKNDKCALIETGHSKKGELATLAEIIQPDCAILTVLANTHLASFPTIEMLSEEYILFLKKIPQNGWIMIPPHPSLKIKLDHLMARTYFHGESKEPLPFVIANSAQKQKKYDIHFPDKSSFSTAYPEKYPFLPELIQIAVRTAWLLGMSSDEIIRHLLSYFPESMNSESWISPQGIYFINEPYTDDPQSITKSLRNLPSILGRKHFIFSGFKQKGEKPHQCYDLLAEEIIQAKIQHLILVGSENFGDLSKRLSTQNPHIEISLFANVEEALKQLRLRLKRDDLVLLKGAKKESLENLAAEFSDILKDTKLTINLAAIRSNIEVIRSHLPPSTRMMAMIKAFAYGTDSVVLSRFLSSLGIDIFGVAHVDEAVSLRNTGIDCPLFVINASLFEVVKVVNYHLEIGISDLAMVNQLNREAAKQGKFIKVHLHIDTGMSRLGCRPEDSLTMGRAIKNSSNLILEGVMTHLASADDESEDSFTNSQIECFKKCLETLKNEGISPVYAHIANSAGYLRFDLSYFNMIRIGLALFGLKPAPHFISPLPLRTALSLTSRIAGINRCKKGESISYGRTYKVSRDMELIGVIPLGYFDGLHRHYSGRGHVLIRGKKAPMIGTICMDFMMVDITDIPDVEIGDPVLIFGTDEEGFTLPPEELAFRGQTNSHELITCLGPRIQRIFIDDEK